MNGYWCATWWHIQYVHTHINVFTLNILLALNPSANFKEKKNLPASVCLLMRCAFSLSDQFSTDTQINHIVVCVCVCMRSVNGDTVNTAAGCIMARLICVPGDSLRFIQNSECSEFKPHTFHTRRVQSHTWSSVCFSTAGTSTLTVRMHMRNCFWHQLKYFQ